LDVITEKLRDKFNLSNEAVNVLEKLVDGCRARDKGTIGEAPIRFGSFEPWPEEDILNKIEAIESPDEEIETVEETEVETIDEPEIETVEDDEIEVSLDSAETEPIEEIHPDRYRFKNQPEEYSNKESTFGMILSRLAFTQGISISSLADMAGLTIDEMKDICNDKVKMSIYHILRLEQSLKMNETDAHRLERLADCDAEIPLYIKKYISDPKIAKILSQVAEAKLPYLCWEKLLKDLR
jgi:transcriptional regulator with XRE-family HTH domain